MSNLKNRIIKLAYKHPELREDLIPLIREADSSKEAFNWDSASEIAQRMGFFIEDHGAQLKQEFGKAGKAQHLGEEEQQDFLKRRLEEISEGIQKVLRKL